MEQTLQQDISLEEQLKQKDGTIQALCGMLSQLIPVVDCLLPLLKDKPQIDQQMVEKIEKMLQISTMLVQMNMTKDVKELGECDGTRQEFTGDNPTITT